MREWLPAFERYGRGRLRDLAVRMMSAAVAVALCAGCANEPDKPAAPPVSSAAPTTTAGHSKYPSGPLTYTVIVPDPEFTGGEEILRATLPEKWSVIEDSRSPATQGLIGYGAGGNLDIPLRFDVAFAQSSTAAVISRMRRCADHQPGRSAIAS